MTQGATLICSVRVRESVLFLSSVLISTLLFKDHFTDIVGLEIKRSVPETISFSTINDIL